MQRFRVCSGVGMGLSLRLKSNLVARWGTTRTTTGGRALLSLSKGRWLRFRNCRPHRQACHAPYRHHPRSRTCRALDHRHVGKAGISYYLGDMPIAGASSPWSLTSNRGGSVANRPIGAIPTVSPPELVEGLILVMSLARYWAVSTGLWDQLNNPTPAENKDRNVHPQSAPEEGSPGLRGASAAP